MKPSIFNFSKYFRGLVLLLLVVFGGISAVSAQPMQPADFNLTISNARVTEGDMGSKTVTVTAQYEAIFTGSFIGSYSTQAITAEPQSDFIPTSGSLHLSEPGHSVEHIRISIIGDTKYEADETFELVVTALGGRTYSAKITILNDDPLPQINITVDDPQVNEGTNGATNTALVYTITRSGTLDFPVDVTVSTADGTATAESDYHAHTTVVRFEPGQKNKTVSISTIPDSDLEPDETVLLNLTTSSPYTTVTKAQGIGTILNDDLPTVVIADAQIVEGKAGISLMTFTLTLSTAIDKSAEVKVRLLDILAVKDQDYRGSNQTITFAPGETTRNFAVEILGDELVEADEMFVVKLGSPVNLFIGDGMAVGTILNDDTLPPAFAVTSFSLIDAKTDTVIIENFEGGIVELDKLGVKKLTILANTNPASVGSVRFALNDNPKFRKDNVAPYTLAKDKNGNLKRWPYVLDTEYTLTATPFSEKKAKGSAGGAKTITFKIIKALPAEGDEAMSPVTPQDDRWLAVPPTP